MAKIITFPSDFGEVRLSLKEYNEMRDRLRKKEEDNDTLTEMLDAVCEENKVRVRRQVIKTTEYSCNPRALGTMEVIEDILVNFEDVTEELDAKIKDQKADFDRSLAAKETECESLRKTLDQCQRQKNDAELEVMRLKDRGLWQRIWNK